MYNNIFSITAHINFYLFTFYFIIIIIFIINIIIIIISSSSSSSSSISSSSSSSSSSTSIVGFTNVGSILVWYTPLWIIVLIYLQTFWNSIMKLTNLRKFCRKMHIHKILLMNAFKNSLIICFFKGYKFLVYRKKNLE